MMKHHDDLGCRNLSSNCVVETRSFIISILQYITLPVVPARGGAEVALKIYIRPFSSIELACAVRRPSPCVRALCENWCLVSHVTFEAPLHTSHLKQSSHSTLHTSHCSSSHCTLRIFSTFFLAIFTLHTANFLMRWTYFTLHTAALLHSATIHTALFALQTSHFTVHTSHFTLHTSHCTLLAPHFTLHPSSHLSSSHLIPARSSSHLISSHMSSKLS